MKILLVHLNGGFDMRNYRTEHLGLGYITSMLRNDGHEVEILDASMRWLSPKETVSEIVAREFDCLGVTAVQSNRELMMSVVRAVRKVKKNEIIIAGGYLPTLMTGRLLSACPELDFVVTGEGEQVIVDVLGRIQRGEDWRSTPGIAYLDGNKPVINAHPPLVGDLDALPFPARDALNQAHPDAIVEGVISGSRGCYHRCAFCSVNSFYSLAGGHAPRFRSAKSIVDELESVVESHGMRRWQFVDDDFVGPGEKGQQRAISIGDEIASRGLKIEFTMECRADETNVDTLKRLKEVGLTGVFLGIESGVQRQLDTFNKRTTVEQNRRAIEAVREVDLTLQPGFILFDPYTTPEELQENMQFIREMGLESSIPPAERLNIRLFPGAPITDMVRKDGLLREKGMEMGYVFKDPRTRMMWSTMQFTAGCTRLFRKISGTAESAK